MGPLPPGEDVPASCLSSKKEPQPCCYGQSCIQSLLEMEPQVHATPEGWYHPLPPACRRFLRFLLLDQLQQHHRPHQRQVPLVICQVNILLKSFHFKDKLTYNFI